MQSYWHYGCLEDSIVPATLCNDTENAPRAWQLLFMADQSVEYFPTHLKMNGTPHTDVAGPMERRRRVRTRVHWPLRFLGSGAMGALETVTQNLSSDGFYCRIRAPFVAGERIECAFSVPAHHPNTTEQMLLECKVRIVRVEEPDEDGLYGIGCRIEDYRFAKQ
jgi:hypothetical protein